MSTDDQMHHLQGISPEHRFATGRNGEARVSCTSIVSHTILSPETRSFFHAVCNTSLCLLVMRHCFQELVSYVSVIFLINLERP